VIFKKVIRAIPKSWEVKATTLKELNDMEEMDFSGFIGNLKAHEMEMKVREARETQKKKVLAQGDWLVYDYALLYHIFPPIYE